jgi:hypothetical protein
VAQEITAWAGFVGIIMLAAVAVERTVLPPDIAEPGRAAILAAAGAATRGGVLITASHVLVFEIVAVFRNRPARPARCRQRTLLASFASSKRRWVAPVRQSRYGIPNEPDYRRIRVARG